ncbi:MAG TPA: hypothetical protein VG347_09740 [Verrucomicrobiae bacterium]|nr:hypothetical protein [Verrucomicrobiae bacterium]
MSLRPKILLLALETSWSGAARLPRALQEAGFAVGVACRAKAYLAQTKFRDHFFLLPDKNYGQGHLAGLRTIVKAWPPDLILPMDDWTAFFLAQVHEHLAEGETADALTDLLKRSLGNPAGIFEAANKRRTIEIARHLGLRVPASAPADSAADIREFGRVHGFPVVLKRSYDNSGNGVFICHDEAQAVAMLARLHRKQRLKDEVSLWREEFRGRRMERCWLPSDQSITVNQHIVGECATLLAACLDGQMLAALSAVKVEAFPDDKGPSSVVRFVRVEEMRRTAEGMLRHWRLTGLIGFDFILDAAGQAWLLECNPRSTPIAHLGGRAGENLCAALHAGLTETPVPPPALENGWLVAHFPAELWRDPHSPHLASAFHDVPVDDPNLWAALKQAVPSRRPAVHRVS